MKEKPFQYLIAHRGNISGPNPEFENQPDYIRETLDKGFDAEVDIWVINDEPYLGHDKPQYKVHKDFLNYDGIWFHAKNPEALSYLFYNQSHKQVGGYQFFWHQNDDITLTSGNLFWTYPGKPLTNRSIAVMPELVENYDVSIAAGVCSDYINNYKKRGSFK